MLATRALDIDEADAERASHPREDTLLSIRDVLEFLIEAVRPKVQTGFSGDQLDINPQHRAELSHATLHDVAHAKSPADPPDVRCLTPISVGGLASDHE